MTGFAVDYRADRVTVASDSLVYDDAGAPVGLTTKVYALPTARCLLFSAGTIALHAGAYARLLLAPQILNFEDAARELPTILNDLTTQHNRWPDDPTTKDVLRVVLAGWSATEGRMRAVQFDSSSQYEPNSTFELKYGGPWPWPSIPLEYWPLDRSADSMEVKCANLVAALDRFCADHQDDVGGIRLAGPIVMTVLTETSIDRKTIGHLASEFDDVELPITDRLSVEEPISGLKSAEVTQPSVTKNNSALNCFSGNRQQRRKKRSR